MRIPCPHCGPRDTREFTYRGDASVTRPDPDNATPDDWCGYVFRRVNTPGVMREYWHHVGGCRHWLIVTRDVTTHEIFDAEIVGPFATARNEAKEAAE